MKRSNMHFPSLVKRFLLVPVVLIFNSATLSQSLSGGYIFEDSGVTEAYYFWEDGEFSWFRFTPGRQTYGDGTFECDSDSLRLKYGRAMRKFDLEPSTRFDIRSEKAEIEMTAKMSNGVPVQGMRAILKTSKLVLVTDAYGYAKIEIDNPLTSDEIRFEYEGYEGHGTIDSKIQLRGWANYFTISVDEGTRYVEKQDVLLRISRKGKSVSISNGDNSTLFKHISKGRFLSLMHGHGH